MIHTWLFTSRIFGLHFDISESLTWRDTQQPSVAPADIVNTFISLVMSDLETQTHTRTHTKENIE